MVGGRGDEMAARAGDGGRLRASHADREQVIGALKAAFVHGVLDKDEFDLRLSLTDAQTGVPIPYAGVWATLILSPLGNDPRLAFALAWTSTLVYLGTLLVTAAAILELRREKRSGRQLPPGPPSRLASTRGKLDRA